MNIFGFLNVCHIWKLISYFRDFAYIPGNLIRLIKNHNNLLEVYKTKTSMFKFPGSPVKEKLGFPEGVQKPIPGGEQFYKPEVCKKLKW